MVIYSNIQKSYLRIGLLSAFWLRGRDQSPGGSPSPSSAAATQCQELSAGRDGATECMAIHASSESRDWNCQDLSSAGFSRVDCGCTRNFRQLEWGRWSGNDRECGNVRRSTIRTCVGVPNSGWNPMAKDVIDGRCCNHLEMCSYWDLSEKLEKPSALLLTSPHFSSLPALVDSLRLLLWFAWNSCPNLHQLCSPLVGCIHLSFGFLCPSSKPSRESRCLGMSLFQ